jgi:hypothetical protein
MEYFRTPLDIVPAKAKISLSDKILTIGSCFSDTIGQQLQAFKMTCLVNPFGTIYNPCSIHKVLSYGALRQDAKEHSFLDRQGIFLNYDFHSTFSSTDLVELQTTITHKISGAHTFLKNAQWIIITYGTSFVYERTATNEIVANCHKMPQTLFTKEMLTQKKIIESFDTVYVQLKSINPNVRLILTVSPVRHLKDTIELNSVSKAVLRIACHTLAEQHSDVEYFPSYEIMMDDLRDYRYYKQDMIHPSDVAEKYIWEKFAQQYFDDPLKSFLTRWKEIQTALAHKPFHAASTEHQKFLRETIKKLNELKTLVRVEEEIALLSSQLSVDS